MTNLPKPFGDKLGMFVFDRTLSHFMGVRDYLLFYAPSHGGPRQLQEESPITQGVFGDATQQEREKPFSFSLFMCLM